MKKIDNELLFNKMCFEINMLSSRPSNKPYNIDEYDDKTKCVLNDIDMNRNHSWIIEILNACM